MTTWALIPVKSFEQAKSRLSSALSAAERARFAEDLFVHVLEAAMSARLIDRVAVVSNSEPVLAAAEARGALGLPDHPRGTGLANVVDSALRELEARGAARVIICMSDLPRVSPIELDAVVGALEHVDLVLSPDAAATGTNVIGMAASGLLPSCLGHDDSLVRHRARARELGLQFRILKSPGLALDVDTPEDLERLHDWPRGNE